MAASPRIGLFLATLLLLLATGCKGDGAKKEPKAPAKAEAPVKHVSPVTPVKKAAADEKKTEEAPKAAAKAEAKAEGPADEEPAPTAPATPGGPSLTAPRAVGANPTIAGFASTVGEVSLAPKLSLDESLTAADKPLEIPGEIDGKKVPEPCIQLLACTHAAVKLMPDAITNYDTTLQVVKAVVGEADAAATCKEDLADVVALLKGADKELPEPCK